MTTKVVTVFAKKGGVGKTTITQNLASYFANQGKRILCVDLDEQGNLTQFLLGPSRFHQLMEQNTVSAILNPNIDVEPSDVIQATNQENIFVAAASSHLKQYLLPEHAWDDEQSYALRDFIDELDGTFDYVFCDTPPAVDTLQTWIALLAAHYAISPVEPEAYSSQSLHGGDLRLTAARQANPRLTFLGYIVNLRKARRVLHQQYEQTLRDLRGSQVFDTVLRDLAAFPEAVEAKMGVVEYMPKSDAAALVTALGEEVSLRIQQNQFQKQSEKDQNRQLEQQRKVG